MTSQIYASSTNCTLSNNIAKNNDNNNKNNKNNNNDNNNNSSNNNNNITVGSKFVDSKFSIHCKIRGSVPVKLLSEAMYYMQHISLVNHIPKAQSIKFDQGITKLVNGVYVAVVV